MFLKDRKFWKSLQTVDMVKWYCSGPNTHVQCWTRLICRYKCSHHQHWSDLQSSPALDIGVWDKYPGQDTGHRLSSSQGKQVYYMYIFPLWSAVSVFPIQIKILQENLTVPCSAGQCTLVEDFIKMHLASVTCLK